MVNTKAVNTVDATRKAKIILISFQICLEASSIQLFNHPCKFFLSLLFIRTLRDLLVTEEDIPEGSVFAEVVHGLLL